MNGIRLGIRLGNYLGMALAALVLIAGALLPAGSSGLARAATAEASDRPPQAGGDLAAALGVMDAFMAAFNRRDVSAWADTLVYPHVRLASGTVAVYPDREAFIAAHDLNAFAASSGWSRSAWDDLRVVQSGPDKVHLAVRFTRYDAQDKVLSSYDSLYVVERIGPQSDDSGHSRWGIRARSSYAP